MADMWYNLSKINGDNGIFGVITSIDDLFMQHLFGTLILVVLFVILFRATMTFNNTPKVSFLYTSFFIAFMAIFFKLLSFISDATLYICIIVFIFAIGLQFFLD